MGEKVGQVAILARSNAVLFDEAVALCVTQDCEERVSFVGVSIFIVEPHLSGHLRSQAYCPDN